MSDTVATLESQLSAAAVKSQADIAMIKSLFVAGVADLKAQIATLTSAGQIDPGSVIAQMNVDQANATTAAVDDLMTTVQTTFPTSVPTPVPTDPNAPVPTDPNAPVPTA
jgi:hypothetical protein